VGLQRYPRGPSPGIRTLFPAAKRRRQNKRPRFAFLAWRAQYRVSGVTTFFINQSGEVFQKDLEPQTPELAKAITSFDPDDTWSPVE
jgi:hypothetical protein